MEAKNNNDSSKNFQKNKSDFEKEKEAKLAKIRNGKIIRK